jgi:DNA-binding CsgD family transcriptional regulator
MTMHTKVIKAHSSPSASAFKKNMAELRQFALMTSDGYVSLFEGISILGKVVPHDNVVLSILNEDCTVADIRQKIEVPLSVYKDYFENFMNKDGVHGGGVTGMTIMSSHRSMLPILNSSVRRNENVYVKSECYNRVLKPAQLGWFENLILRKADYAPLVQCIIGRSLNTRNYTDAEHNHLQMAQPWLEHIARQSSHNADHSAMYLPDDQSATMIINTRGDVLHASDTALSLLRQAANLRLTDARFSQGSYSNISLLLNAFGKEFMSVMRRQQAFVPSYTTTNCWGRFSLRAYAMKNITSESIHIALHVEKLLPVGIKMFKSPNFIQLTLRERDICLHLLANLSHAEIAAKLGIKTSSVDYHTKNIYMKLGIQAKHQLLDTLLGKTPYI